MTRAARRDVVLDAIVCVASVGCAVLLWREWCAAPAASWNGPHLLPAFAVAHGLDFYGDPDTGAPALGWIYGPVLPVLMAPIATAPSLAWAFVAAGIIQTASLLLPIGLLLRAAGFDATGIAFGTTLAVGLLTVDPVTYDIWRVVRTDSMALGGALGSLALLVAPAPSRLALHGSALLAAVAILSKQIALPIALAGPLVVAARRGRRDALAQLVLVAGYLAVLLAGFVWWFGADRLIFGMWTVPSRHPLRGSAAVLELLRRWITSQGLALIALGTGFVCGARGAVSRRPVVERALCGTAILFVPAVLPALAKLGGELNSFYAGFFWTVACTVVATRGVVGGTSPRWLRRAAAVCLLAMAPLTVHVEPRLPPAGWWPGRTQDDLLLLARDRGGRLWVPGNPLPNVVAGGPLLPFDDGVRSLHLAGLRPAPALLRAHVPDHVDHLLCVPSVIRCPLPEFPEFVPTGELFWGYPLLRRLTVSQPAR